jgi:hypothetical protein
MYVMVAMAKIHQIKHLVCDFTIASQCIFHPVEGNKMYVMTVMAEIHQIKLLGCDLPMLVI